MSLRVVESRTTRTDDNLLVLMHGYGSDEQDLLGLAPYLGSTWRTVCLGAPRNHPMMGYAWFDLEWSETGVMSADLDQARQTVQDVVEAVKLQLESKPRHAVIGGFSQGAMMALAACESMPRNWHGLAILSGRYLPIVDLNSPLPPTLIQHGTSDAVIPVEDARELRDKLQGVSAQIEYHEYAMGHQISEKSLHDLQNWLQRRLIS